MTIFRKILFKNHLLLFFLITLLIKLNGCSLKQDKGKIKIITHEAPIIKEKTKWNSNCKNTLCSSLLKTINSAEETLDIAVYGVRKQPKISEALLDALDRGVKIRLVYDNPLIGENYYNIKQYLNPKLFKNAVHDTGDAIMHNKFVIADQCKVWTGSANLSNTGTGGYNSNIIALIKSCYLGTIYEKEFSQLYSGNFHTRKDKVQSKEIKLKKGGSIQIFFSPKSKTIEKAVIPLLKTAQKSVNIPMFYLTHKKVFKTLKKLKSDGVEIKVILDATAAQNEYVLENELREIGIATKVENWGGKMHMKVAVIDKKHLITGSMNFTKAGNSKNDENTVIIKNAPRLAKQVNNSFQKMWNSIPEEYLYKSPKPESLESINSCFDGMDNDFNEKVDKLDPNC